MSRQQDDTSNVVLFYHGNAMSEQADYPDPRANLIEDLLSRQEDVIQQLDDLEKQLIATIDEIRPPKEEPDKNIDIPTKRAA